MAGRDPRPLAFSDSCSSCAREMRAPSSRAALLHMTQNWIEKQFVRSIPTPGPTRPAPRRMAKRRIKKTARYQGGLFTLSDGDWGCFPMGAVTAIGEALL